MTIKVYKDGDFAMIEEADFDRFKAMGWSKEKAEKPAAKPKRARKADGTLKADDPSTPDVNEAWEGGKAPKKKSTRKKS